MWSSGRNLRRLSSDDEVTDASEKLSSSFHATGYFGGLSTALTWQWESGFFLEWTLVVRHRSFPAKEVVPDTLRLVVPILARLTDYHGEADLLPLVRRALTPRRSHAASSARRLSNLSRSSASFDSHSSFFRRNAA